MLHRVMTKQAYRKTTQLASRALLVDGQDLRDFARNAEHASTGLQETQSLHIDQVWIEKSIQSSGQCSNVRTRPSALSTKGQNQHSNRNILHSNKGILAIGAER